MDSIRLPRFRRSSNIPPIRITDRDQEILEHVYRHRFLRSDHLTSLLPGSRQQVLRRLQRLYHHGHLERPRCQIDYYRSGSRRMSYGIGNKGAVLLRRELALPFHRMQWQEKGRVGRLFLDHALLVSDVMVALERACKDRENVRLLTGEENPLSGNRGKSPSKWSVDIGSGLKCGVVPDRVFGLEIAEPSGRKHRSWFCLEADRATMPVIRGNFAQSSFYRKLLAYEATWAQDMHRTRFGWQRFRVLTVTSNPERIATMQEAAHSLERGQGLFLFTDTKSLGAESDIFALRWQTCRKGETATLLD